MASNESRPWSQLPAARSAALAGDRGTLVRLARTAAGLTLAEAGSRVGYSAATMSRFERGRRPLTDVVVMRRFAEAFDIPSGMLGLRDTVEPDQDRGYSGQQQSRAAQDGEDPMRRRDVLTGIALAPLLAAVPPPATSSGNRLFTALHDALLHPAVMAPAPAQHLDDVSQVKADLDRCMRAFQASNYPALTSRLPPLVRRAAQLPLTDASSAAVAAAVLNTVSRVLIKFETPGLGWISADRALAAARASGDPAVMASCTRSMVSLCRRDEHYGAAQHLALDAVAQLDVDGPRPDPGHLCLQGMLLGNAAYAAAQDGRRDKAAELLDAAQEAADRLGGDGANLHWTAFGPTSVRLHRISVAYALGDAGTAISHARLVDPQSLRLPERRSRYWVDVARAWEQWGRSEACFRALLAAERDAPEEIRARPVVADLARKLLDAPVSLPGVRDFARRVGAA